MFTQRIGSTRHMRDLIRISISFEPMTLVMQCHLQAFFSVHLSTFPHKNIGAISLRGVLFWLPLTFLPTPALCLRLGYKSEAIQFGTGSIPMRQFSKVEFISATTHPSAILFNNDGRTVMVAKTMVGPAGTIIAGTAVQGNSVHLNLAYTRRTLCALRSALGAFQNLMPGNHFV